MQPLTRLLLLSILLGLLPAGSIAQKPSQTRGASTVIEQPTTPVDDDAIGRAFGNRTSDVQVEGKTYK